MKRINDYDAVKVKTIEFIETQIGDLVVIRYNEAFANQDWDGCWIETDDETLIDILDPNGEAVHFDEIPFSDRFKNNLLTREERYIIEQAKINEAKKANISKKPFLMTVLTISEGRVTSRKIITSSSPIEDLEKMNKNSNVLYSISSITERRGESK